MDMIEAVPVAQLSRLHEFHPALDPGVLRNDYEKSATFYLCAAQESPVGWKVDCRTNRRCAYGQKELAIPVAWESFDFGAFQGTKEERKITEEAGEAMGLLFLGHLTGMTAWSRAPTKCTESSTSPDWICGGGVFLENKGVTRKDDLKSKFRKGLKKKSSSAYTGEWLVCASDMINFQALFGGK